jgi:hypothetical protein
VPTNSQRYPRADEALEIRWVITVLLLARESTTKPKYLKQSTHPNDHPPNVIVWPISLFPIHIALVFSWLMVSPYDTQKPANTENMCSSPSIDLATRTTSSAKSRIVRDRVRYWNTALLRQGRALNYTWIAFSTRSKNNENRSGEHGHPYFRPYITFIPPNPSAPFTSTCKCLYSYYN